MPHKLGTPPPTRTILSINLRFLRHYVEDRTGLEVARYVGVSEQDIKDWEHCLKQPTIDQAYLLADYLNVEPLHLLEVDFGVLSKEARLIPYYQKKQHYLWIWQVCQISILYPNNCFMGNNKLH